VEETWAQLSAGRGPTECCWVVARIATALLLRRLADREHRAEQAEKQSRWRQHDDLERGNAVRVFEGPELEERK